MCASGVPDTRLCVFSVISATYFVSLLSLCPTIKTVNNLRIAVKCNYEKSRIFKNHETPVISKSNQSNLVAVNQVFRNSLMFDVLAYRNTSTIVQYALPVGSLNYNMNCVDREGCSETRQSGEKDDSKELQQRHKYLCHFEGKR